MRALLLTASIFLSACAPTTNELILEANISGNWTAVNARMDAEDENESGPMECRDSFILACASGGESCTCVLTARFEEQRRDMAIQRGMNRNHKFNN
jgi:hypothetical protein